MASTSPIKYYVVDAFAKSPLTGNPAAVCCMENEREEYWLQAIAQEFNLSATCYVTKLNGSSSDMCNDGHANGNEIVVPKFRLRWFAPAKELKICGHGTIASAYVLFQNGMVEKGNIEFHTKSGKLLAERIETTDQSWLRQQDFSIRLTFPLIPLVECSSEEMEIASKLMNCSYSPVKMMKMAYEGELTVEYSCGKIVADLQPSIDQLRKWPGRGVVVTGAAPEGSGFDFYSRFFCPNLGMDEDPVCGSIHCGLAPYWSKKLGKSELKAYMASSRGGVLELQVNEESREVFIQGKVVHVMKGSLFT